MSSSSIEAASIVTFAQVASALRRRVIVVIVAVVLGLLAGTGLTLVSPPGFSATATVVVAATADGLSATSSSKVVANIATEMQIARSTQTAELVKASLGSSATAKELLAGLDVTSPADSSVIKMTYTGDTPEAAAAGANAFAQQYLVYRTALSKGRVTAALASVDKHLANLRSRQAAALDVVNRTESSVEKSVAQSQLTSLEGEISEVSVQKTRLEAAQISVGDVVGKAVAPDGAVYMTWLMRLGIGAALGLMLGAAIALLRDLRDPAIQDVPGVEAVARVPVLAEVSGGADFALPPDFAQSEQYRRLAVLLLNSGHLDGPLALVPAGAIPSLFPAAGLADAVASFAKSVALLTAADRVGDNLGRLGGNGATTARPQVRSFGDESELRSDVDLEALAPGSDYIVVDAINLRDRSAAVALAARSHSVVIVAILRHTATKDLRRTVSDLQFSGVQVAGVCLLSRRNRLRGRRPRPATRHSGLQGPARNGATAPFIFDTAAAASSAPVEAQPERDVLPVSGPTPSMPPEVAPSPSAAGTQTWQPKTQPAAGPASESAAAAESAREALARIVARVDARSTAASWPKDAGAKPAEAPAPVPVPAEATDAEPAEVVDPRPARAVDPAPKASAEVPPVKPVPIHRPISFSASLTADTQAIDFGNTGSNGSSNGSSNEQAHGDTAETRALELPSLRIPPPSNGHRTFSPTRTTEE